MRNTLFKILFVVLSVGWGRDLLAGPKDQVLDFEGEVIEGERKKPDIFLQISTKDLDFDSLLYLRKNFNDYLEVDRKSRNRYFKVKSK